MDFVHAAFAIYRFMTEQQIFKREILYELVWSTSLLSLSKQYAISYSKLRNACIKMNIPLPKNGHWQQVRFGKAQKQPPLPLPYNGDGEVRIKTRGIQPIKKRSSDKGINHFTSAPKRLVYPHPLVLRSKAALSKAEPDKSRFLGMLSCGGSGLDIKVTKTNAERALRFMDRLIKGLEAAGHFVALQNGRTFVTLGTDSFRMQLREQTTRTLAASQRLGFTQYQSTGKLAFSVGIGHMREFREGMYKLEEQLPIILEHFEAVNREWLALRLAQRIKEDAQKKQERILREMEDRTKKELQDFTSLLEKAARWQKADNLRRYIDELERRVSDAIDERLRDWLQWARLKADWYDPFLETIDALMVDVIRENLAITYNKAVDEFTRF